MGSKSVYQRKREMVSFWWTSLRKIGSKNNSRPGYIFQNPYELEYGLYMDTQVNLTSFQIFEDLDVKTSTQIDHDNILSYILFSDAISSIVHRSVLSSLKTKLAGIDERNSTAHKRKLVLETLKQVSQSTSSRLFQ